MPTAAGILKEDRLHAVDALRVFAMTSVVFLHASVSYMTLRMPNLIWGVRDTATHPFFDWLFFFLHGLPSRIFFLVAGFFAAKLYERRGARGFLENRARRILVPFLVGGGILLPLIYFIWCVGWIRTAQCNLTQILRMRFDPDIQRNIIGPAHLWFLEFLLIYYAAFFVRRRFIPAGLFKTPRRFQSVLLSPFAPLFLTLPVFLFLLIDVKAAIDFHNTFVPDPVKLLYYGVFFLTGVCLYEHRDRFHEYTSFTGLYLFSALMVFPWMGTLIKKSLLSALTGTETVQLALSVSLFACSSVFACIGFFMRFLNRERRLLRYLSGAAYWIYLCHFPVVGILQVILLPFDGSPVMKFVTVSTTAIAFGLLSYEWLVRRTLIGVYLSLSDRRAGGTQGRSDGQASDGERTVGHFTLPEKIGLSAAVILLTLTGGVLFQRFYNSEKDRTEWVIAGFYPKYLDRKPDTGNLRYWTSWALNRWGLEKVEQDAFMKMRDARLKENASG